MAPIRSDATPGELHDPYEREQAARFRHSGARATFVVSRRLQRAVLARYLGTSPDEVVIDRTCAQCGDMRHGRPTVNRADLEFSVSHSGGWCLIAVARRTVGVDVERVGSWDGVAPLVTRTLNGFESAVLAEVDPQAQAAWFYRAWARKEAASKAAGVGLRTDMRAVDSREARTSADGIELWLRDIEAPSGYAAALASADPIDRLDVLTIGDV